jgi:hypothetical protein
VPTPVPTPQPRFYCNWNTTTCEQNPLLPPRSLAACGEECKGATYSRCNNATYQCEDCAYNPVNCTLTKAVCTAKCAPTTPTPVPAPGPHYYCDWNVMMCKQDPNVPEQTAAKCHEKCKAAVYARCNEATHQCEDCDFNPVNCTLSKDVCVAKCAPTSTSSY